jgi:hypothetical protein
MDLRTRAGSLAMFAAIRHCLIFGEQLCGGLSPWLVLEIDVGEPRRVPKQIVNPNS